MEESHQILNFLKDTCSLSLVDADNPTSEDIQWLLRIGKSKKYCVHREGLSQLQGILIRTGKPGDCGYEGEPSKRQKRISEILKDFEAEEMVYPETLLRENVNYDLEKDQSGNKFLISLDSFNEKGQVLFPDPLEPVDEKENIRIYEKEHEISLPKNKQSGKIIELGDILWPEKWTSSDSKIASVSEENFVQDQLAELSEINEKNALELQSWKEVIAQSILWENWRPFKISDSKEKMKRIILTYKSMERWQFFVFSLVKGAVDFIPEEILIKKEQAAQVEDQSKVELSDEPMHPDVVDESKSSLPKPGLPLQTEIPVLLSVSIEKATGATITQVPQDDDASLEPPSGPQKLDYCSACFGPGGDALNPIIHCVKCKVSAHQFCAAVPLTPSQQDNCEFLCCRCDFERKVNQSSGASNCSGMNSPPSQMAPVACCVCRKVGGLFKQTIDGLFVHLPCAAWLVPEVECHDVASLDFWDLGNVEPWRKEAECSICQAAGEEGNPKGICIRCAHPDCKTTFHPLCAWLQGAYVEINKLDQWVPWKPKMKPEDRPTFHLLLRQFATTPYCFKHTPAHALPRSVGLQREIRESRYVPKDTSAEQTPHASTGKRGRPKHPRNIQKPQKSENNLAPDRYLEGYCAVCLQTESFDPEGDILLCCEKCGTTVHWKCYGAQRNTLPRRLRPKMTKPNIKQTHENTSDYSESYGESQTELSDNQLSLPNEVEEDPIPFVCEVCTFAAEPEEATCLLCPRRGGALKICASSKETTTIAVAAGRFAHMICAMYAPGLYCEDNEALMPIRGLEYIQNSSAIACEICLQNEGFTMICSHSGCPSVVHPLCAQLSGCYLEQSDSATEGFKQIIFCKKHSRFRARISPSVHLFVRLRNYLDMARTACEFMFRRENLKADLLQKNRQVLEAKYPVPTSMQARYGTNLQQQGHQEGFERQIEQNLQSELSLENEGSESNEGEQQAAPGSPHGSQHGSQYGSQQGSQPGTPPSSPPPELQQPMQQPQGIPPLQMPPPHMGQMGPQMGFQMPPPGMQGMQGMPPMLNPMMGRPPMHPGVFPPVMRQGPRGGMNMPMPMPMPMGGPGWAMSMNGMNHVYNQSYNNRMRRVQPLTSWPRAAEKYIIQASQRELEKKELIELARIFFFDGVKGKRGRPSAREKAVRLLYEAAPNGWEEANKIAQSTGRSLQHLLCCVDPTVKLPGAGMPPGGPQGLSMPWNRNMQMHPHPESPESQSPGSEGQMYNPSFSYSYMPHPHQQHMQHQPMQQMQQIQQMQPQQPQQQQQPPQQQQQSPEVAESYQYMEEDQMQQTKKAKTFDINTEEQQQ
eukprot:GHVP01002426.1.p1 GENE.GHVP01002426.1~~GHVP01002426.1.p1  ORF type:complete len:1476 (-),score=317.78 GHVP01002426.1:40-4002(-)